ncbi:hypothetical protein HQ520_09115, partial [bacterium]|nr:hypothetical protein [bacterium]
MRVLTTLLFLLLTAAPHADPTSSTLPAPEPIQDPATLETLRQVQQQVENLRGIERKEPLPAYYFDSDLLTNMVQSAIDKQYPEIERKAFERFLLSLGAIEEGLDIAEMYRRLLDEQAAGFYDPESKRLFVHETYDITGSALARLILAHEICHALQDHTYDLRALGIEDANNDDLAMAILTVAEGDATVLTAQYAAAHGSDQLLQEAMTMMFMDQSALQSTPYFFRQALIFPYLQGQVLVQEALDLGPGWRDQLFT